MKTIKKEKNGFTLIELLVVVAVFAMVVTLSIGVIMQVLSVNKKVRSMSSVMDNISSVLEIMTIEMRYGRDYYCIDPDDCNWITFYDYDNTEVNYFLTDNEIWKTVGEGSPRRLSTPEATIDGLHFHIHNDLLVMIVVKGRVGSGPEGSEFSLQTAVSQRQRHEEY